MGVPVASKPCCRMWLPNQPRESHEHPHSESVPLPGPLFPHQHVARSDQIAIAQCLDVDPLHWSHSVSSLWTQVPRSMESGCLIFHLEGAGAPMHPTWWEARGSVLRSAGSLLLDFLLSSWLAQPHRPFVYSVNDLQAFPRYLFCPASPGTSDWLGDFTSMEAFDTGKKNVG